MRRALALLVLLAGCATFHAAPPPGAPADATFVDAGGVQLHYRELGRGDGRETVVLIHGFSASVDTWRGVHEALAAHFHVIAFDLAGFGLSGRPEGVDYSPVGQARLVWRALDRLGVGDVALVGHSWGSSVVLTMAVEQPRRVRRVALYSAYVYEDQVPSFFHWARLAGVGEALFATWYRERIEDRVALAYHDDRFVTQARVEHVERELGRPGTVAAALAAARGQDFTVLERHWPSIRQPVLLLWGDDDQVTPLRYAHRLARELPDAELKVYPATGHIPMVESRNPTTKDLLAFLSKDLPQPVPVPQPALDLPVPDLVPSDAVHDLPLRAAADLALLGAELSPRRYAAPRAHSTASSTGHLRVRTESLRTSANTTHTGGDLRLRTDLAFHARGSGVAVKARVDVLDNVALGSTPILRDATDTPAASPGQAPPVDAVRVERVWGEVLTPAGILAAGRMGAHFGLGMVAHGGDCDDCDGGDAADRLAFVAPVAGHLLALSYDFTWSGPQTSRPSSTRPIDLAPTDDVTTVTATLLRARTPASLIRRAVAGRSTVEYGLYVSHRWQRDDIPAAYLPIADPPPIDAAQLVHRDFAATSAGAWLRILLPRFRLEAEGIYAHARVGQPSLVPGVTLTQPATSDQVGLAVETEARAGAWRLGVDGGFASGDDAPGFTGAQADPPGDTTVDNFRFHPDYRIDRLLFREIIGTVTDAAYVRPHAAVRVARLGHAWLEAGAALVASWAIEPTSTPTGERALGVEVDPTLSYVTRDGFRAALEHAIFFPGAAFGDTSPAQLVRLRLGYVW